MNIYSSINYENNFSSKGSNYLHLVSDLPYVYGIRHIQLALQKTSIKTNKSAGLIRQEPPRSKQILKDRIFHLIIGVSECIPLIGIIIAIVDHCLHQSKFLDPNNLIKGYKEIPSHQNAWYLNLSLLRNAYDKAPIEKKKQIQFLASNFLNKACSKELNNWPALKAIDPQYFTRYQGSPIEETSYHREFLEHGQAFGKILTSNWYMEKTLYFFLLIPKKLNTSSL